MPRILIVEDELVIQEMYTFKLGKEQYEVKSASNGLDGLKLAEEFHPDLILLDLMMPVMNGSEMLERLRKEKWGANIRVIILTNLSKNEAPMALRFLHVDRYVIKAHSTPSQVVEITREVLKKA